MATCSSIWHQRSMNEAEIRHLMLSFEFVVVQHYALTRAPKELFVHRAVMSLGLERRPNGLSWGLGFDSPLVGVVIDSSA